MTSPTRRAFSVSVFARRDGQILLIKHKALGTWLPVGGEVKEGEAPLDAAKRELFEETGLTGTFHALPDVVDGTPAGLLAYEEHPAGKKGIHQNFCFVADVGAGEVKPNHEFDSFSFVSSCDGIECPRNVRELVPRALANGRHPHVLLARAWLAKFNARDLDGLLALYADDAVHVSPKLRDRQPETRGEISGKAALRAWWADAFARLKELTYVERRVVAEGDAVFLEYLRTMPGEADLVVAELYEVRDGKIVKSHVFHG